MLGKTVTDSITGFSGVVTGHVNYLTGCNQSLVQPRCKGDGDYVESRWFDDDRLVVDSAVEDVSLRRTNNGPDKPAPIR